LIDGKPISPIIQSSPALVDGSKAEERVPLHPAPHKLPALIVQARIKKA
jgi:hypothetical protein